MTISAGDAIPQVPFTTMTSDGPGPVTADDLFKGKKVVLFGLPGAFTPTCSAKHVPGYIEYADAIKAKGVDTIACMSVNDAFVMGAWGRDQNVGDNVLMLADGSAKFAEAAGLNLDLIERGMGMRCQRFAMIVDDGVVSSIFVEGPGEFEVSSAEAVLGQL
jgi:glutaredoxin/glutathione-dependent peroxiredoxin